MATIQLDTAACGGRGRDGMRPPEIAAGCVSSPTPEGLMTRRSPGASPSYGAKASGDNGKPVAVTPDEVARLAGVERSTASRALNDGVASPGRQPGTGKAGHVPGQIGVKVWRDADIADPGCCVGWPTWISPVVRVTACRTCRTASATSRSPRRSPSTSPARSPHQPARSTGRPCRAQGPVAGSAPTAWHVDAE